MFGEYFYPHLYRIKNGKLIYKTHIEPKYLYNGFSNGYYVMKDSVNNFPLPESICWVGCNCLWWVKCNC
jgi:hypothetical protein